LNYLNYLLEKGSIDDYNKLTLAILLINQSRFQEAQRVHKQIKSKNLSQYGGEIHYDYVTVYLDVIFGHPDFKTAREVSSKYTKYPIKQWRDLFSEVHEALSVKDQKLSISLSKFATIPHLSAQV